MTKADRVVEGAGVVEAGKGGTSTDVDLCLQRGLAQLVPTLPSPPVAGLNQPSLLHLSAP